MADHDWELDWQETYKSMVSIATAGFKFLALANGGAAIAILAYLGNSAKTGCSAPDMRLALGAFLVGLVLCGGAMAFAYELQRRRLNKVVKRENPAGDPYLKWSFWLCVLSLIAFGGGSFLGVNAYQGAAPTAQPSLANARDRPSDVFREQCSLTEPASASPLQAVLHICSGRLVTRCTPAG